MKFPGFVGSSYTAKARDAAIEQAMNLFLEYTESPRGKVPSSLLSTPGFDQFCELPKLPVRGTFSKEGRSFAVGGNSFYELSVNAEITERPSTVLTTPLAPAITPRPIEEIIARPTAPIVTPGGNAIGSTTYGYKIIAKNDRGSTNPSDEGFTAFGNASLSSTNYNDVTWAAVTGATSGYDIYRTTGGGTPPRLIGSVDATLLSFRDVGYVGVASAPPGTNTTGGTVGATSYGYKIVAILGLEHTAASSEGTTAIGPATLSSAAYNTVSWTVVENASSYQIYRTTGGLGGVRLIGTAMGDATSFRDTGIVGTAATPPAANTTGSFTIVDDGFPVQIFSSGDQGDELMIIGAGRVYIFNLATNVLAFAKEGATSGGFLGGYFIVLDAGTSTVYSSELFDGMTWDATQIYRRQLGGDRWRAMAVTDAEIWLIGSASGEVWVQTGDDETRFAPYNNIVFREGIIAPLSLNRELIWLSQNEKGGGKVMAANGYTPQRISTHAIETALKAYSTLADAFAFTYQEEGHEFYVLSFPTAGATWVYDRTTNEWHERGYWNSNTMRYEAYRPQCHTYAFGVLGTGKHLVGDRLTGIIAVMSTEHSFDLDGSVIRRVRRAPHLTNENKDISFWLLELLIEVGLGTTTGAGDDPTAMLRWSDDGAKTWSNERWARIGKRGEYRTRVRWKKLGSGRNRVFEVVITDPVPVRIIDALINPESKAA